MPTIIKARGIEKSFNLQKVLENIDFDISTGERIGLVGYNGTGKTSLANILFGKITPDKGQIEKADNCKIGYLTQSIEYQFNDVHGVLNEDRTIQEYTSKLGLDNVYDWEEDRAARLSGGEKLKLALSLVWASKPDFLILDEPTNHLDYRGIEWLVSEIKKFQGPVLIISHDRHFLDRTINRIMEIENKKLQFYNGNYSDYRAEKQHQREVHQHHYAVQQHHIETIEKQMEQLKAWSEKAHLDSTKKGKGPSKRQNGIKEYHRVKAKKRDQQMKSKMKRLESELEKNNIAKPFEEATVRFQFESQTKRGKRVIQADQLSKSFGNRLLFQNANFYINRGERIGLIGINGCGKTTLIKMLLGEEPISSGELWVSESLKIAYLSQDVLDLPEEKKAIDALGLTDKEEIFKARTYLANLGLKEELILKPIRMLSLGERTRVKLVEMLMKEYDVLILDEPTNHLDLPSREQIEKALSQFKGTILTISHDYYFVNKLCDRLLVFENETIKRIDMKPDEYFNKKDKTPVNNIKETLMIIENQLAVILGKLSLMDQNSPDYEQLDRQFRDLVKEKRMLLS